MAARSYMMAIVGVVAIPAMAQLGRVEDGRAGHAGLRVGSGGYNLPLKPLAPRYGNQIVTGNITRGRHFRGFSPISATTDFGGQLGTTTLDNFRRDSVGVDDIRPGYRSYRPRPYYSPTRTVTSVGGLSVGFRPSGAWHRPQGYVHLPPDPFDRGSREPQPFSREIRLQPRSDRPGPTPSQDYLEFNRTYAAPPTRSALFGVAPDPAAAALARQVGARSRLRERRTTVSARFRPGAPLAEAPETVEPAGEDARPDRLAPPGSALDRLLNPERHQMSAQDGAPGPYDRRSAALGSRGLPPASRIQDYGAVADGRLTEPDRLEDESGAFRVGAGGDVYRSMLRAASILRDTSPREQDQPGVSDASARTDQTETGEQVPAAPRISAAKQHDAKLRALLDQPIGTFAGVAETMANKAFKNAEQKLAAGRYYEAVLAYDMARAADPSNPLVWIGRAHSLIGAGDYLSASVSLEEGLTRFPQIGRFQIDLKAFLSHQDILDLRRADLERRLEREENYRLRFVLGYIEYFTGLSKFGLPNLERAAEGAPTTSIISKFPKMLSR